MSETLSQLLLRTKRLPEQQALPIAIAILQTLEAAHADDRVYGFLNPEEVRIGDDGSVELSLEPRPTSDAPPSEGTAFDLNVRYYAPEQSLGEGFSSSVDVYACGVMLYQMLTGSLPFAGENVQRYMSRQMEEAPRPFSDVHPGGSFTEGLEDIVMQLLCPIPVARMSAGDAQEQLSRFTGATGGD